MGIWRSVHNPHRCRACACNLTVLTHSVGNGSGGLTSPRGTMTTKPWICPYMEICTQSTSLQGLCLEICLWTIHIYVLCPFYAHIWRSLTCHGESDLCVCFSPSYAQGDLSLYLPFMPIYGDLYTIYIAAGLVPAI